MTLFKEWQEAQAQKRARPKKSKTPPVRFRVTPQQAEALKALGRCRFGAGSYDKRFVRDLQDAPELTQRQGEELARLVYRYRKQLGLTNDAAIRWKADLLDNPHWGNNP